MKLFALTLWALLPLGLAAFHYGPGQDQLALDESAVALESARVHLDAGDWTDAIGDLEQALATLPQDRVAEAQRIRLELNKARMQAGGLPEARADLALMVDEIDAAALPELHADTLAALASARFHMTYLMKLEGLPETEWEPEIEAARQEHKFLLAHARLAGDEAAAARHADDLEADIKLARTDPADLYGKAIPKPCQGCSSGNCPKPAAKPGKQGKSEDSRDASSGPPIDGEGS